MAELLSKNFAIELPKRGKNLHYAAYTGDLDLARMALGNGADVNEVVRKSYSVHYSPLHCAAEKNDERMIHLLVSEGADVKANLKTEGTPLHIAIKFGCYEAVKALLQYDIDIEARSHSGGGNSLSTYFMSASQIERSETDSKYFTGFAPLHCLAEKGNSEIIHSLLNYGADINAIHDDEGTPLHRAIQFGNEDAVKALLSHDSINVNTTGSRGTTLHYAALWCREDFIRLILNRGSNVDVASSNCNPEFHVAFRIGYDEAVRYLSWYAAEAKCEYHIGCTKPHLPKDVYLWSEETDLTQNGAKEKRRNVLLCFHIAKKFKNSTLYLDPNCIDVIAKHAAMIREFGGYLEPMTDGSGPSCKLEQYLKEAEGMKTNCIKGSRLTYYDILTMTVHEIAKCIENDDLLQHLKLVDHCKPFPMFGIMIKRQVYLVAERRELMKENGLFFSSLPRALKLSRALPFLCIDRISSYLSNDDLGNLIMKKHMGNSTVSQNF